MSVFIAPSRYLLALVVGLTLFAGQKQASACAGQLHPDVNGIMVVEQEDYFSAPSIITYSILVENENNELEKISIDTPVDRSLLPKKLSTGLHVKLHGKKVKDAKTGKDKFVLNSKPTSSETGTAIEILPNQVVQESCIGPRNVIAILVDFTDSAVSCSAAQMDGIVFSNAESVASAYSRSSYGKVNFVRDTNNDGLADVYRVSINYSAAGATACNYSTWLNAADSAVTAQFGVNLSAYNRKLYYLGNGVPSCGWAGLGTLGQGWSIVNGNYCATGNGDVAAHELGHNENMYHSATDTDNNGVTEGEYQDTSDIMGYAGVGLRHFNAPHKVEMGWMPAANVLTANSSQSVTLTGLELNTAATQVLKASRAAQGGGNYYLSFRTDDGVLTGLPGAYKYATNIHWYSGRYTYFIRTLSDGESYSDPASGVTFTQSAHTPTAANVNVSFACVRHAPTVSFSPANVSTNVAGATGRYTVVVTNTDSGCVPETFSLAQSVPAAWTSQISSSTMLLSAGASGSVSFDVQSSAAAADGRYPVSMTAASANRTAVTGSATYTLDRTPPAAITNLSGSSSRGNNSLVWGAPSDGSGSGLASYRVYRNGAFLAGASSTSYADLTPSSGVTYSYTVTAIDVVGNQSAQSNVATVTTARRNGKSR